MQLLQDYCRHNIWLSSWSVQSAMVDADSPEEASVDLTVQPATGCQQPVTVTSGPCCDMETAQQRAAMMALNLLEAIDAASLLGKAETVGAICAAMSTKTPAAATAAAPAAAAAEQPSVGQQLSSPGTAAAVAGGATGQPTPSIGTSAAPSGLGLAAASGAGSVADSLAARNAAHQASLRQQAQGLDSASSVGGMSVQDSSNACAAPRSPEKQLQASLSQAASEVEQLDVHQILRQGTDLRMATPHTIAKVSYTVFLPAGWFTEHASAGAHAAQDYILEQNRNFHFEVRQVHADWTSHYFIVFL